MKLLSSDARNTTAFAISSGVPNRPSGTMLLIIFRRCSPVSEEASKALNPGVSIEPGLTAFTRMRRGLRSVVHVRANERTAALVALYTLFDGSPLLATTDAQRTMEEPSLSNGNAFCMVKSSPFTLTSNIEAKNSSVISPRGAYFAVPSIREHNVETTFLLVNLSEESSEVTDLRHISLYPGDAFSYAL